MVEAVQHVAIIMDGNRRWASIRGLSVSSGHEYVVTNILEPLIDRCIELRITHLTFWAFSTENWNRPAKEIKSIMKIFRSGFKKKANRLHEKGVRLRTIGDLTKFDDDIKKNVEKLVDLTNENKNITVTFGLNYGGRDEIIRAIKKIVKENPSIKEEDITEEMFSTYLDTYGIPDPELIIRPSGQIRLSGFMPWQSVYSEFYFTETLIPDFTVQELDKALNDFSQRKRRFGK